MSPEARVDAVKGAPVLSPRLSTLGLQVFTGGNRVGEAAAGQSYRSPRGERHTGELQGVLPASLRLDLPSFPEPGCSLRSVCGPYL